MITKKLIMVSVSYHGRRLTRFVNGVIDANGKAVVSAALINDMWHELGATTHGATVSIG